MKKEQKAETLFRGITNISDAAINEAASDASPAKRAPWVKWGAVAACACLLATGAFMLARRGGTDSHAVLQWSAGFRPEQYFQYNYGGMEQGGSSSIDSSAIPYAQTRSFSDARVQLEAEGVIPRMENHPLLYCGAHYNADGSFYSIEFVWSRRGTMDDYSDLKVTAGYQEVPALEDYIYVETDGEGNILEPAVTVTERDGVQIVAEGRENRNKSLTFETDSGWYRIEGSFNDGYAAVAELLDWVWEHPIDFARFPIEAGDAYDYVPLADCPDAFSEYLPDFAAFGFTELETHVTLKNGAPVALEGHYTTESGEEGAERMHWCITAEPDYYDLERAIGTLEALTEAQVYDALAEGSSIAFLQGGCCVIVFPQEAAEAWALIASLQN